MADLPALSRLRKAVYEASTGLSRASGRPEESKMIVSSTDIVMAAIAILAVVGAAISFSAWRHAAKMEREATKSDGLPSAI
jgi:hypothetical protein